MAVRTWVFFLVDKKPIYFGQKNATKKNPSVRRAAFALAISLLGRWACSLISLWLVARVLPPVALRVALRVLLRVRLRALLRVLLRVLLRMVLVLLMSMVLQPPRHPPSRRRRHRRSPTVDRSERSGADRIGSD